MSEKSDRRAAREAVAAYHEEQLTDLVVHVGDAIDRHRAGDLDAWDVDEVIFQYSRAAKELWKFCNLGPVDLTARFIREEPPTAGGSSAPDGAATTAIQSAHSPQEVRGRPPGTTNVQR